jgi:hypothetical protein
MFRREFMVGVASAPMIDYSETTTKKKIAGDDVNDASTQLIALLSKTRGGTWVRSADAAGDFILFRKISA